MPVSFPIIAQTPPESLAAGPGEASASNADLAAAGTSNGHSGAAPDFQSLLSVEGSVLKGFGGVAAAPSSGVAQASPASAPQVGGGPQPSVANAAPAGPVARPAGVVPGFRSMPSFEGSGAAIPSAGTPAASGDASRIQSVALGAEPAGVGTAGILPESEPVVPGEGPASAQSTQVGPNGSGPQPSARRVPQQANALSGPVLVTVPAGPSPGCVAPVASQPASQALAPCAAARTAKVAARAARSASTSVSAVLTPTAPPAAVPCAASGTAAPPAPGAADSGKAQSACARMTKMAPAGATDGDSADPNSPGSPAPKAPRIDGANPAAIAFPVEETAVEPVLDLRFTSPTVDGGPENIAVSKLPVGTLPPGAEIGPIKNTLVTPPEIVTSKFDTIGTGVATVTATMTAAAAAQPPPALDGLSTGFAGAPAGHAPSDGVQAPATSAVDNALHVADLQASASQATQSAVNLHFEVGGENLSVRVALQEGQVHTQFSTDSSELRSALAHEWQSVASAPAGSVRYADPVFTPESRGEPRTATDLGGNGGQWRNPAGDDDGGERPHAAPSKVPLAAVPPPEPQPAPAGTSVATRFHSFA